MDLTSFLKPVVAGVPLMFVVLGLVQLCKAFKNKNNEQALTGNTLLIISLLLGLLFGGGWMISQTRPPAEDWWILFVYWFGVLVYGLAIGLVASGFYEVLKETIGKQLGLIIEKISPK